MRKRARIIYNPVSGRELVKRYLVDILAVYEQAGYETSAFATTPEPLSAENEARRAALSGVDLIVVAGGDGTIYEVVNGIAGLEKRPKMAIIPGGTTNDYARALHIPRENLVSAAEVIYANQSVHMDIGKLTTADHERFFVNIGAAGYLTELTYEVPANMKSLFGSLAYFVKGAEMLPRLGTVPMEITYDGGSYNGEASMFFVALTNSVAGFEEVAPDKRMGDGNFTLIVVKTANLIDIFRLITLMMNNGKHIDNPNILYTKTNRIEARTADQSRLMVNIDGEYGGDAPATFVNLRQHIEMIADVDSMLRGVDPENIEIMQKEEAFIKEVKAFEEDQQKE